MGGYGVKGSANAGGLQLGFDITAATKESIIFEKGKSDVVNSVSSTAGISVFEYFGFSVTEGKQHLYNDSDCTCNWLNDTYKEKISCPASQDIVEMDSTIGFGLGGYAGIGGEFYIGFDVETLAEEWDAVIEYSVANY